MTENEGRLLDIIVGVVDNPKLTDFRKLIFRLTKGKFFSFFFKLNPQKENSENFSNGSQDSLEEIIETPIEELLIERSPYLENKEGLNEDNVPEQDRKNLEMKNLRRIINNSQGKTGFLLVLNNSQKSSQSKYLLPRIQQLINSFNASYYEMPKTGTKMIEKLQQVKEEVSCCLKIHSNLLTNLNQMAFEYSTSEERSSSSKFSILMAELLYAQHSLENLNKLKQNKSLLEGLFWIPSSQLQQLTSTLDTLNQQPMTSALKLIKEDPASLDLNPPSHFIDNTFTYQFQQIVNTYGIPSYKEINPAIFTIITFPFLFGVMYGDMAHGSILLLGALWVVYNSEKISNKYRISFLEIRSLGFLLVLMGIFSVYAGLVYNDFLALPVTVVKSCFENQDGQYGMN